MKDKYRSFAVLAASESKNAYAIRVRDQRTSIVIVAPHGGAIEPGTSEIALSIAGAQYSSYLFEGMKARNNHRDLHITSIRFDEPSCLSLISSAQVAVTVHGEESSSEIVYVGGLHSVAIAEVRAVLERAGFWVREHGNVALRGHDSRNICNRGMCGKGVQLELSRGLRESFFRSLSRAGRRAPTPRLSEFGALIRRGLDYVGA